LSKLLSRLSIYGGKNSSSARHLSIGLPRRHGWLVARIKFVKRLFGNQREIFAQWVREMADAEPVEVEKLST
jgi:hypothetical protein